MVRTQFAVCSYRVQGGPPSMATDPIQARQANTKSQCSSYTMQGGQNDIETDMS